MKKTMLIALVFLLASTTLFAAKTYKVYINNKKVSSSAIEMNKTIYIPVKDVASALNLKIKTDKKSGKVLLLQIVEAVKVGEIPLAAVEGKVNSWVSNGSTKLMVENFERTQKYDIYEPPDEGGEFVILSIRQQNETDDTRNIGIDIDKSYLEDSVGKTHPPYLWKDEKGNAIAPGASIVGEIVFAVPKDLTLRVLVLKMVNQSEKSIRVKI